MKKLFLMALSIIVILSCVVSYSYADIVIVESNKIKYEIDLDILKNWYVDKSTSFADCYWVLFDNEVDRGTLADANSDGLINGIDCVWILQHIAGWDHTDYTYETHGAEFSTEAADVNNDGRINLSDVSLLMKYVVGWFDHGLTGTGPDHIGLDKWGEIKRSNDENGIQTPSYFEWLAQTKNT